MPSSILSINQPLLLAKIQWFLCASMGEPTIPLAHAIIQTNTCFRPILIHSFINLSCSTHLFTWYPLLTIKNFNQLSSWVCKYLKKIQISDFCNFFLRISEADYWLMLHIWCKTRHSFIPFIQEWQGENQRRTTNHFRYYNRHSKEWHTSMWIRNKTSVRCQEVMLKKRKVVSETLDKMIHGFFFSDD